MEKVYEMTGRCPVCGGPLKVSIYKYKMPSEEALLLVGRCSACGYRFSDVIPVEEPEERTEKIEVNEETLHRILHIFPGLEVEIPELGLEARLTEAFSGRITTLEGLLYLLLEGVKNEELEKRVREVVDGKRRATVVLKGRFRIF